MSLAFPKPEKVIDEEYKSYIRNLPCAVCMSTPTDPDHLKARGWREASRNDYTCLPLCRKHHSERGQYGDTKFQELYKINLWKEAWQCVVDYFRSKAIDGTTGL
jgi:hypothetical protein